MKLQRRSDIEKYLSNKLSASWNFPRRNQTYFSWNIKIRSADFSGHTGPEKILPRFDSAWEQHLEKTPDLFAVACEDALAGLVGETKFKQWEFFDEHPDAALASVSYELTQAGHSGGWLVLEQFDGYEMSNPDFDDFSYENLWLLYKFCTEIDNYVDQKERIISETFNFFRAAWEDEKISEAKENSK